MPRIARAIAPGHPHHVTQRGNYRQLVFETEDDYRQYITWLKDYSGKYGLHIWAYCLMSNHVHFICVPQNQDSLAKTFNALHMRYLQYVNQKKGQGAICGRGSFIYVYLTKDISMRQFVIWKTTLSGLAWSKILSITSGRVREGILGKSSIRCWRMIAF